MLDVCEEDEVVEEDKDAIPVKLHSIALSNIPKAITGLLASIPNRIIEVEGGQLRCQCDGGVVRERADYRLPQGRELRTCPVQ
ncbi:hypothetical protein ACFX2I_029974 [Malus domestica]